MTPKYKLGQWVYFIKTRDGIHIGHEPISEINQTLKETRYRVGSFVCPESDVFASTDELKAAFDSAIEKLLAAAEPF